MANDADKKMAAGNRLAKVIARAGLCSRRQAEQWIVAGRVAVNGADIRTPAFNVTDADKIVVDGQPLAERSGTRVWLYHKPGGLVVTENDPEGRKTIFKELEQKGLPRVLTIGRLDINTEGLLMLTNDGGLKRVLELPATGWLRRYRVRAHGKVTQVELDRLKKGVEVDGIKYGPIEATLEREQGSNVWMQVSLREGKNREVKNVLAQLGLQVNRLIRTSFGPFQLGDIPVGAVTVVRNKVLRDQLGTKLAKEAGVDFDSPLPEDEVVDIKQAARNPNQRLRKKSEAKAVKEPRPHGRTGAPKDVAEEPESKPRRAAPQRRGNFEYRQRPEYEPRVAEKRVVHFSDGRASEEFEPKAKRKKSDDDDERSFKDRSSGGGRERSGGFKSDRPRSSGPSHRDGDRPRSSRPSGDRPSGGRPSGDRPRSSAPSRDGASRPSRPPKREGASRPGSAPRAGKGGPRPSGGGPRKGPPRGRPSR